MSNESGAIVVKEPKLYDLFNQRCIEDIEIYTTLFKDAHTILELGIGTGRLAIPLAERGFQVDGVDISIEMLEFLQTKISKLPTEIQNRIIYEHQDFCRLSLSKKYKYACFPFCTFNYLLTVEQQVDALMALRKHLVDDAIIVFDLMTIHTFKDMLYHADIVPYETTCDTETDMDVIISTQGFYNQATQIYTQERFFKYFSQNDCVIEKRVKMVNRIIQMGEFQLLLDKCGYKITNYYGNYNFSEFNSQSQCLIVMASIKK
jgi:Cyclopropane fatty acid synthase and related methyltransferases